MLFIIDPWIWIALGLSVWLSLRRERAGMARWTRPAWTGFAAVCAYILANGLITGRAEAQVADLLRRQGQGGTPFLDELAEMPMDAQTRLLRVLQSGEFTTGGGAPANRADL